MTLTSSLYVGDVVHRRLRPVRHGLRYRVYNLFVDVDELRALPLRLRTFGYNSFNLFSIRDSDHGPGDGTPIAAHAWQIARRAQTAAPVARLFMFTYPRVLGYVFNPLTVYYGFDASERLCLMTYEVNNTFGERHTYVLPVEGPGQQQCRKQLYVSPFNRVEGTYHFTISPPADTLNLAIALTTGDGPCMSAWFNGDRVPLTDLSLLRSFCSLPLQPLRVIAGIHAQAARLWLKGLRVKPRPPPPTESISFKSSEHLPQ